MLAARVGTYAETIDNFVQDEQYKILGLPKLAQPANPLTEKYITSIWKDYKSFAVMNLDFAIRHRVEDMSYAWSDGIGKLTEGLTEKWLSGHRKEVPGIDMPYKPSDKGGNDTNGGNPRGARKSKTCDFYNNPSTMKCKKGANCGWPHRCSGCGGKHPFSQCPDKEQQLKKGKGKGKKKS